MVMAFYFTGQGWFYGICSCFDDFILHSAGERNHSFALAICGKKLRCSFTGNQRFLSAYSLLKTAYAIIQQFIGNILFDEKIGGTVHMALGRGYPETGSTNVSAIHWDMICDLRQGGKITVDGETLQENGKFTV